MMETAGYKFIPPPENAAKLLPSEARELFRRNGYYSSTSGFCTGFLQTNVAILPGKFAGDFEEFCRRNHGPLPLIYRSKPGEVGAPPLAEDVDIRSDLPRYLVYSKGRLVEDTLDLSGFSWEDRVSFYIGCSFTFEEALEGVGVEVRNITEGKNVSMFKTNIALYKVGEFGGEMLVTMRPVRSDLLVKAVTVTAQFSDTHGAPIHIGDPARIGIADLAKPDRGGVVEMKEGEVPVFWACGITVGAAIESAKPDLAFAHYPGSMFIADIKFQPREQLERPSVVPLSRDGDPFFASIVGQKAAELFADLEKIILDDPYDRGARHLFQKDDLIGAVLALSHSNRVAVTTGFPCLPDYEVKEETDGLPGALAICQALAALGKEITLISDVRNQSLFQSCVSHMVSIGALKSPIPVIPFPEAKALYDARAGNGSDPPYDCLLAIERAGRASDGTYRTMKAVDISRYVDSVDDLFLSARSNARVATICIGDGGNELGMGKVYAQVKKHIPLGETIACAVPADFVIAAGVSNWGGYAVALGLCAVSSCPLHWRYRNRGIDAERPPNFRVTQFLPTAEQTTSLLKHMNGLGIRDGITKGLDQSVDGLSLETHLKKLAQIASVYSD